jgi:hypothetical protein
MTKSFRIHRFKPGTDGNMELCAICGRGPNSAIHRGAAAPQ